MTPPSQKDEMTSSDVSEPKRWEDILLFPPSLSLCCPRMGGHRMGGNTACCGGAECRGDSESGPSPCGLGCSITLCRIWQFHPAAIGPPRGFLKACGTPWAPCCGGNAARGTSFTLLVRNVGFETVRVGILQMQDVQQQQEGKRAMGGRSNL